jgi:hypothetical protein
MVDTIVFSGMVETVTTEFPSVPAAVASCTAWILVTWCLFVNTDSALLVFLTTPWLLPYAMLGKLAWVQRVDRWKEVSFRMIIIRKCLVNSWQLQVCKRVGVLLDMQVGSCWCWQWQVNPVVWPKCFSIAGVLVCSSLNRCVSHDSRGP